VLGFHRVAGAVLRQRDVGSFEDRFGKSRGISYPRSLLSDSEEAYTMEVEVEGPMTWVDLPEVKGCVGRVWDEHAGGREYITVTVRPQTTYNPNPIIIKCRQGEQNRGSVLHH